MDWSDMADRYGGLVWRAAKRLLDDEHEAADCFQETFLAALELSGRQSVANWPGLLARIATNQALDRLRRRYRRPAVGLADAASVPGRDPPPGSELEARELADRLTEALVELPDQQAQVFCLHHFEELGHDQIAAALDIEPGNVRVLLHRARAKLREHLERISQ